jgi:hypothetical protein
MQNLNQRFANSAHDQQSLNQETSLPTGVPDTHCVTSTRAMGPGLMPNELGDISHGFYIPNKNGLS